MNRNGNESQPIDEGNVNIEQNEPYQVNKKDIAVIGMACRFPNAKNYEEYWENLKQGISSIQEIPKDRWDWREYFGDPNSDKNKTNSKWGGFIEDVASFEPGFFGISPREAEFMDPQQRIMLELSWSCFEDAGICPSQISGKKVGVYIGTAILDYKELQEMGDRAIETHYATGVHQSVVTSRISFQYNFKGPSIPVDTACSSSLYAIHMAAQALHYGDCNMALVGGVNVLLTLPRFISFAKMGLLSPTGSCKTFDESADGIVRGEGAGLILLKSLDKAIEDGDYIYGVIKGSAINHSGKTHTISYPSAEAQAEVITEACIHAGITPDTLGYVEAHGTGTSKGDPIEFEGLNKAFQNFANQAEQKSRENYCGVGSVKTNIGHLESSAGIAGVIKVLLSMKHKQIPGLQNFKKLNHRISIQNSPFYIAEKLHEWKTFKNEDNQVISRRACVNAFGFAGTNASVIIEEAPKAAKTRRHKLGCYLICLSAKTEEALKKKERDLAAWLEKNTKECDISEISSTLLLGREHFEVRAAYVVEDIQELKTKLNEMSSNGYTECSFREILPKKEVILQPLFKELGKTIIKDMSLAKKMNPQEYRDKIMALAELYVRGYEFDWKMIFTKKIAHCVGLPTYPFAKEKYWLSERGNINDKGVAIEHKSKELSTPEFSKPSQIKHMDMPEIKITKANQGNITLQSLQDYNALPIKQASKITNSITLTPLNASISKIESENKPKPEDLYVQPELLEVSQDVLQIELKGLLAEALYLSPNDIELDTSFIDMGMDSIVGVEWVNMVNKQYGKSISATKVYDYPNIREFAKFMGKELNTNKGVKVKPQSPPSIQHISEKPVLLESSNEALEQASQASQESLQEASQEVSKECLQTELKELLSEALYLNLNDIELDTSFIDMGMDSIVGVEWINMVNKQYGTTISATKVYDYPNIREFGSFLEKELGLKKEVPVRSFSLEDVLQKVQQGSIDIMQAEQLLN